MHTFCYFLLTHTHTQTTATLSTTHARTRHTHTPHTHTHTHTHTLTHTHTHTHIHTHPYTHTHTLTHTHTYSLTHTYTHTPHRGFSSTVRKCVRKDTGQEYAVKIVDKSQEESITESIAIEMQILRSLPHHKHISKLVLSGMFLNSYITQAHQ